MASTERASATSCRRSTAAPRMAEPSVRHAIVLAAGRGERLRSVVDDRPKGLVEIDGETLVARSLRLLRAAGIDAVTIVAGHRAGDYLRFAAGQRDIRVL